MTQTVSWFHDLVAILWYDQITDESHTSHVIMKLVYYADDTDYFRYLRSLSMILVLVVRIKFIRKHNGHYCDQNFSHYLILSRPLTTCSWTYMLVISSIQYGIDLNTDLRSLEYWIEIFLNPKKYNNAFVRNSSWQTIWYTPMLPLRYLAIWAPRSL